MTTAPTLPALIGSTENALRALLVDVLAATPVPGYAGWVVLTTMSVASGNPRGWRAAAADRLKQPVGVVDDAERELRAAGLVDDGGMTEHGEAAFAQARRAVQAATSELLAGIAQEDQDAVRRVLAAITRNVERRLVGSAGG